MSRRPIDLLLQAIERATPEQMANPRRPHICANCSRHESKIRAQVPHWRPKEAESWIGRNGVRVWSALCAECAQLERDQRVKEAVANGMSRDLAEQKYGVAKARPGEPARREQVG